MEWHWWGPPGWFWLIAVLNIAFWIAVIGLIVSLLSRRDRRPRIPTALTVLEERYARGEISREEFVERRAVLLGEGPTPGG